ncbi:MAG: hypothetical protein IRZ16_18320 [Myxococcaceae bacterium]|nr:hypothetical protein [Myxococcaceae bacterium]
MLDLTYRTVDVSQGQSDLAVRFVQPQGLGENVVLRVAVSLLGTSVDAGEAIDLAEPDALGNPRGRASRAVIDDPLQELPPIGRGELLFHRTLLPGETVPGELHITFSEGTTLASGRTVFGSFEAKVQ